MKAVLDVETTITDKGHPFNKQNKLVVVGVMYCDNDWNYIKHKYYYNWEELKHDLKEVTILLGFNFKFDLHWLQNVGIKVNCILRDAQLAEHLLSNQRHVLPSLDSCAFAYLNERKLDIIKLEYWDKGIDTPDIPKDLLEDYLFVDLDLTRKVYQLQEKALQQENKWSLYKLQCADLGVLQDVEYNGIFYDKEESELRAYDLQNQIDSLKGCISAFTSCPTFNLNSGDHLSCLLYGGTIIHTERYPVGTFKTGKKLGETRYKLLDHEYTQERLVEPIKGSELKKEGYWSTEEGILKSLKIKSPKVKELVESILTLSKLEKLKSTYYLGIPKLMSEKNWLDGYLHGQFNQCITITGRLSSSKPNMQNFDPKAKQLCVSQYDN